MVRTRLATLTLAGALLLTSSGCGMLGSGCGLLGGLRSGRNGAAGSAQDCCCHDMSAGHEAVPVAAEGPVLVQPAPTFTGPPPAPTSVPTGPAPRIIPIPATPMPWAGQH